MADEKRVTAEFKKCSDAIEEAGGSLPVFKPADNIPQRHFNVAVIGDSLVWSKYPEQLEKALQDAGWDVSVQNLGIGGRMMDYAVKAAKSLGEGTDLTVIALGGNDAIYGIMALGPDLRNEKMAEAVPGRMKENLEHALGILKDKSIPVMLAGMKAPALFPEGLRARFDAVFTDAAHKHGLVMDPFIMNVIVKNPESKNLGEIFHQECMSDGIHPNTQGGALIATDLAQEVQEALLKISGEAEKRDPIFAAGVSNPPPNPGAGH